MTYRTQRIFIEALGQPQAVRAQLAQRILQSLQREGSTAKNPLISTGLQPGVSGRRVSSAVSTASRVRGKAVKTAKVSHSRQVTGLKPGANEKAPARAGLDHG